MKPNEPKTYKRETAIALLLANTVGIAVVLWYLLEGQQWQLSVSLITTSTTLTFGFVALAFGMDWWGKQAPQPTRGE